MNRIWTTPKSVILALILLFVMTGMEAAEGLSGLSGKVVDVEGNAVAGFVIAIQPVEFQGGLFEPDRRFLVGLPKGETDAEGAFTISDIQPGPVQLIALPDIPMDPYEKFDPETFQAEGAMPPEFMRHNPFEESDKKIISIQIGNVTFFTEGSARGIPRFLQGFTFEIEPGRILEDVKVTVKSRLRIRGRVLHADGTPLANAEGDLTVRQDHEFLPHHGGTHGTNFFTDADGYFTHYPEDQEPGFYTLSVEYTSFPAGAGPFFFSAGAGPFLLKDGVQPEVITLTLERPSDPVEPTSDDNVKFRHVLTPAGVATETPFRAVDPNNIKFRHPPAPAPAKSVWIINPINGHAYKRIQCENYHDAQRTAVAEGAHLVSINDEIEQHWLNVIFTHQPFWIGLSDAEKEGEWQWDSGEPVTYTNWATRPTFPDRLPDAEKDYVVVTFAEGGWQSAGPESPLWRITHWAVIEKDGLVSIMSPTPKKPADK